MKTKPVVNIKKDQIREISGERQLTGWVENHPNFHTGAYVYSSKVLEERDEGKTIETLNTIYKVV